MSTYLKHLDDDGDDNNDDNNTYDENGDDNDNDNNDDNDDNDDMMMFTTGVLQNILYKDQPERLRKRYQW
jgi:hypothetical protein